MKYSGFVLAGLAFIVGACSPATKTVKVDPAVDPDQETVHQLRSLGYLDTREDENLRVREDLRYMGYME